MTAEYCSERIAELENALAIARTALEQLAREDSYGVSEDAKVALAQLSDPAAALAECDQAQRLKGWQDCIDSVRGSLRGYPNCGGDIEIMQEVERIASERDRAIERKTAERCVEIANHSVLGLAAIGAIRREFNLDPKPTI